MGHPARCSPRLGQPIICRHYVSRLNRYLWATPNRLFVQSARKLDSLDKGYLFMKQRSPKCLLQTVLLIGAIGAFGASSSSASSKKLKLPEPIASTGISGGLCLQIGADHTAWVEDLARTGRFVIQLLDTDASRVQAAQKRLLRKNIYGLVSADQMASLTGSLPYTENLVNLVIVRADLSKHLATELHRIICPGGAVLIASSPSAAELLREAGFTDSQQTKGVGTWLFARKPWPNSMDEWTHPRHSASGNAVSNDSMVGPPRRVRWIAGAWAEIGNVVTGSGCNYYGGILARDGFNGLRLWEKDLAPSPAKGGFGYKPAPGSAQPVTADGLVFVVFGNALQAMDARTGQLVRTFHEAKRPNHILLDDGIVISVETNGLKAFKADTGRLIWTHEGPQPRYVVAGDGMVGLLQGNARRGDSVEVVVLEKQTGKLKWKRADYPWAARITRTVYHDGLLTFEVSTLNNDGPGNAIHLVTAKDGELVFERDFFPGMNHVRQARPMFIGQRMWLLEGGHAAGKKREPTRISSVYLPTGKVDATYPAGLAHCFPPVATVRYLFSGVMDLTNLETGQVDDNCITKAACGRDAGWVPAHGLIYVTPKHCVCWPMLRGYASLAPARPGGNPAMKHLSEMTFPLETGVEPPATSSPSDRAIDWPCYRHDPWRSASTTSPGPSALQTVWSVQVATAPDADGPILEDWNDDPFIKGWITPPVITDDTVVLACPNKHQVVALHAATGKPKWQFTANGRVDTPPTLYQGLCLFGSKNGWVYCLRLRDGKLVWRLRAAPHEERIVTYGQVESPWPVPGSILVIDGKAFFAAGRQSFADGGILVFSIDPRTGKTDWIQRLNSIPQKGYYTSSALEFDNFDLLMREGNGVAMSRWVFDRDSGKMSVDLWKAFARVNTGHGSAMVPPGCWSYAPRNQSRTKTFSPKRPLVVYRDNVLFGCLENKQAIYRRDFDLEGGETFNAKWITGWAGSEGSRKNSLAWRSQRLSEKAKWTSKLYDSKKTSPTIDAMALASNHVYLAGSDGKLQVISPDNGHVLQQQQVGAPVWDGMAIAGQRVYMALRDGRLICLGSRK